MKSIKVFLVLLLIQILSLPHQGWAHSFDERYDLPLPLNIFVFGSGLIVLISFGIIFFTIPTKFLKIHPIEIVKDLKRHVFFKTVLLIIKCISLMMFFIILGACYFGDSNPLQNLAPNLIWISWWLGFSILIAIVGNFWPIFNPWLILWKIIERVFGISRPILNKLNQQKWGVWVATIFLLIWSWLEVVYPVAFVPFRVGNLILAWTVINLIAMFIYGAEVWLQSGDVFSIYFSWLGKFGIFKYNPLKDSLELNWPGIGLVRDIHQGDKDRGLAGFVIAMLSTVLFDGLHGNQIWLIFERYLAKHFETLIDVNGYFTGTIGLLLTWGIFLGLYRLSCYLSKKISGVKVKLDLANHFASSLVPIAIAYLIAHNFSSFVIQNQNIIFLISDPFNMGWNLLGSKDFRPNIAIIEAGFVWYLAISAIVIGHVLSLWIGHLIASQITKSKKELIYLTAPLTVMMVALTMLSLIIIAEPMTIS